MLISYPCIETATYFKITPRIKLSVSNLIHVFFFLLLLFWSNSIPIIARNSSKTMLLPSQQLTNSSSPCTHRDSIGTSSRDCRVLNFRIQNNKARFKGSISVKGRRYGSKNASSVISNWRQPPSISLEHFDSYLLRRSCRTITEENVLGVLSAKWPSYIIVTNYGYINWQVLCFHYPSNALNISTQFIDESKKEIVLIAP